VLRNWCSNWGSNSLKGIGRYFKIFPGYLHKELLLQIPLMNHRERTKGDIQKYIISENDPYLSEMVLDVLDTRHGASVKSGYRSKIKGLQALIPWYFIAAVNYVPKRLFRITVIRTPIFVDYQNWLRDYHRDFIIDILNHDNMVTADFFKKDELDAIVRSYLKGDNSLTFFLARLIGLELWLKRIGIGKEVEL
jgi:hypothetical protein